MFAELGVSAERVLELGRAPNASHVFNMTHLALNGARRMNGVSRIHGAVSSRLCADRWPEVPPEQNPVGYVTNGVHVPTFLAQTWSRFFDGALDPERLAWYARQQEAWPRESILQAIGVLVGTDLRPRLSEVQCPVLLMHADSSPFIPVGVMADMHAALKSSRLKVFPRARHGLPFSHARECAVELRRFLEDTGPK